jgi:lantibiotic modifying enzyme
MWCHGSVGICAERLGGMAHDDLARADAVGGLAGARAHAERLIAGPVGPGAGDELNASVCHGLAGLIDLFLDAGQVSGDPTWTALAGALADRMIDDARRPGGWRSGVPGGHPAPGLMLGRAGTAWALLRLAEPDAVPSVWRPPVIAQTRGRHERNGAPSGGEAGTPFHIHDSRAGPA